MDEDDLSLEERLREVGLVEVAIVRSEEDRAEGVQGRGRGGGGVGLGTVADKEEFEEAVVDIVGARGCVGAVVDVGDDRVMCDGLKELVIVLRYLCADVCIAFGGGR